MALQILQTRFNATDEFTRDAAYPRMSGISAEPRRNRFSLIDAFHHNARIELPGDKTAACVLHRRQSICSELAVSAGNEGIMDELIARLAANVGLDQTAAEKAVGIIFEFLHKEGPADKVQALIDRMPGAEALMRAQEGSSGGGMFALGGIMGAGTKMMAAGLSMSQVQGLTREVIAYAREKAGEDTIGEIVGAIPGLSQFV
jgi:hypothetical protein